jgi:hypothetical protein
MKAKIVTLSETGSDSTQIRSYIINAYNTWSITPEYLLFVGNKYQVPFPRFIHPNYVVSYSDNYYANMLGDFHNELYHGRLWVDDTNQLRTVVAKIIHYEKDPYMADSLWFRKGVTIVNEYEQSQPPSDSLYWEDARYAINYMVNAGYVHIDSFSTYLGHDSSDVLNAINDGRTYILYRGIGFVDWLWPFQGIHPAQMTNGYEMPVVLSATCATIEGIGHDWLTAGTPNQPKGIVGFFGTTTSLFAAAEMRSALCRGTTASIFGDTTSNLGKAAEAGRLEYYAQFQDLIDYHSWTYLGDPEMSMWTGTPEELTVGHNMFFSTGICTAAVYVQHNSAPLQGALVCVAAKYDSSFYHYAYTNSAGSVQFIDTLHIPGDSVYFTVTGHNLRTYHNARPVYYSGGPYVNLSSYRLSDSLGGNHDNIANPAEDIEIPFSLRNWGNTTAYGVSVILEKTFPDTLYTIYDTIKYVGDIAPLESVCIGPDGFNVVVDSNCPDLHTVDLHLRISDSGSSTWFSNFNFIVHAPNILYNDYYFTGNMKYTPAGDTNEMYVQLMNIGSYQAVNLLGKLTCIDSFITIIDSVASFGTIPSDSLATNEANPFVIYADPNTPSGHVAELTLRLLSGPYSINHNFTIYVGQKDYLIWDPDPNHSSGPIIHTHLAQLNYQGDYSETFPHEYLHLYKTLFTCVGMNPDKYIIYETDTVVSEIEQFLDAGGRMYLEGGDVWYYDPTIGGYSFASYFGISPTWNSIGPCPGVLGATGTFTHDMHFSYGGENSSIDRIDPAGAGILILTNTFNGYGCGVAANNLTVGMSLELGGLIDSIVPSTKAVLIDSIMNYFGVPATGVTGTEKLNRVTTISLNCHPNPFKQIANIEFSIHDPGSTIHDVSLEIYDVTGRLVRSFDPESCIMNRESRLTWDGRDGSGRSVAQGIYFVHLSVTDSEKIIKIILLQ